MTSKNRFGGPWTLKKIEILKKYLNFYTTALRDHFTLYYADAFAGTGRLRIPANPITDSGFIRSP